MLRESKNFRELKVNSLKFVITITYRGSHREVFLEYSCNFDNKQIILLSGTIVMELKNK